MKTQGQTYEHLQRKLNFVLFNIKVDSYDFKDKRFEISHLRLVFKKTVLQIEFDCYN
jgi:hypothetical protein